MLDYTELSNEALADQLGKLDALNKQAKQYLDIAKAEYNRRELSEARGNRYTIKASSAVRWTLDSKAVKAEMGEDWFTQRSNHKVVRTIRVTNNADQSIAA